MYQRVNAFSESKSNFYEAEVLASSFRVGDEGLNKNKNETPWNLP